MKYTADEGFNEIRIRGRKMKLARQMRLAKLTGAIAGVAAIALFGFISVFSGSALSADPSAHYGSFLLSPKSGLYILLAVVFFALGVTVTLVIQHFRKKKKRDRGG